MESRLSAELMSDALALERERLLDVERTVGFGLFEWNVATGEIAWSAQVAAMCGVDDLAPTFDQWMAVIHPDERIDLRDTFNSAIAIRGPIIARTRVITPDLRARWLHVQAAPTVESAADGDLRYVGVILDTSAWRRSSGMPRQAEYPFQVGFEHAALGMSIRDLDGRFQVVNPALCRLLGRDASDLIGHWPVEFAHPVDAGENPTPIAELATGEIPSFRAERRYLRPDGEEVYVLATNVVIRDTAGDALYLFGQVQDITERKRDEIELARLALHDPLTGLPNRALLFDRLATAIEQSEQTDEQIAVFFLDLDQFKDVNDSRGHNAGDEVLVQAAHRLAALMRPEDTVARFGGDEFALICSVPDEDAAILIGTRLLGVFEEPMISDGSQMIITASIGITRCRPGLSVEDLIREADAAMYRAKDRGGAQFSLYSTELRELANARLNLALALRHGVDRHEFFVRYQPIYALPTGKLVGCEALVRWQHPTEGVVSPDEFIPTAEKIGLIVPIGEEVLQTALGDLASWRHRQIAPEELWMSVNLSGVQLVRRNVLEMTKAALDFSGINPTLLHFEITESMLLEDTEARVNVLRNLRALGVHLKIDDFGSGYSSLQYIKELPVDGLKIDQSFVRGLTTDRRDAAICQAIIDLANPLGLTTTAEGVERAEQVSILRALGCDLGQGLFWSAPVSADEFCELLDGETK